MLHFRIFLILAATTMLAQSGCAMTRPAAVDGELFVRGQNDEQVWEKTVDVVHDYFFIERENHFDHVIETQYKTGSSLLEPWQRDTVGFHNRLESTLQSIRRKAFIHVIPVEGGHLVSVQVHRELEDVPNRFTNSPGGATFRQHLPLQRELEITSNRAAQGRWLPAGRDFATEQDMLKSLQTKLSQ